MSRGQQGAVYGTASSNSAADQGNAQSSYGDAQTSIGDYKDDLAKFVSGNPYTAGGEYDQNINKGLTATSDAGSNSLKGALQSQALRTGQNSAADAATSASGAQQNTRDLSSALASAQQGRIGAEAGYNTTALGAGNTAAQDEAGLYGTSSGAANSALGTAANAAKEPSFWDTVGSGFAKGLGEAPSAGLGLI